MTTYITFVLDETGSMQRVKQDTIGGFNSYLAKLKEELKDVKFSFLKFNTAKKEWVYEGVDLGYVAELNDDNYRPSNATPLWDAFALGITKTEEIADNLSEEDKVIISVLTDGLENSSVEYTQHEVKKLIEEHSDWAINFLGADMDAWNDVSKNIGISAGATLDFDSDDIVGTMSINAGSTVSFARGETTVNSFYEDKDGSSEQ